MVLEKKKKIDRLYTLVHGAGSQTSEALGSLSRESGINEDELRAYIAAQNVREHLILEQPRQVPTGNPFIGIEKERLKDLTKNQNKWISRGANLELARRDFFYYCHLLAPDFYKPDRGFLLRLCRGLQAFMASPEETVMIVNLPPRHGKSRTAGLFSQWVYGCNPAAKIMTGSYNETLSTTFSKTVRNGIQEVQADPEKFVFRDIFPGVCIKAGDGAMNLWSLEGQYASYLATSPGGTATGFGASLLIVDDLIKSALEAFNEDLLESQWRWFTDTMLSRLEEGGKIIIIMTRWASRDLAGRAKEHFSENGILVREMVMQAVQKDGKMLCPEILSRKSYEMKKAVMSEEIVSANYQQIPVDLKGCLYTALKTYEMFPVGKECCGIFNYTDTADTGEDYLCSICYQDYDGDAYITDILYTQDGMEITEPATAAMLEREKVNMAEIESNNGGRGFARNVQKLLKKRLCRRCVVKWFHQSDNKRARILSNSTWVMEHIHFPADWKTRWPEFYRDIVRYQKAGKNAHDDGPDALTGIAEHFVKPQRRAKTGKRRFGL